MSDMLLRAQSAWAVHRDAHPSNNNPEQRRAFIAGYCGRERELMQNRSAS